MKIAAPGIAPFLSEMKISSHDFLSKPEYRIGHGVFHAFNLRAFPIFYGLPITVTRIKMSQRNPSDLMHHALLYAILDLRYITPARAAETGVNLLAGGADLVQLRAKGRELAEIREVARQVLPLCRAAGVPFILNDFPELAAELGADGVHIGQDDGPLAVAREIMGPGKLVGRSTHSLAQARTALAEGFDYIGFGPLFPTPTKAGRPAIGLQDIAAMEHEVGSRIPAFCIGGVKRSNLAEVSAAGARRIVVVSDLLTAPDIAAATREVRAAFCGISAGFHPD